MWGSLGGLTHMARLTWTDTVELWGALTAMRKTKKWALILFYSCRIGGVRFTSGQGWLYLAGRLERVSHLKWEVWRRTSHCSGCPRESVLVASTKELSWAMSWLGLGLGSAWNTGFVWPRKEFFPELKCVTTSWEGTQKPGRGSTLPCSILLATGMTSPNLWVLKGAPALLQLHRVSTLRSGNFRFYSFSKI